jgi:alkylhydroperoxidase family enzyme
MPHTRPPKLQAVADAILGSAGHTERELRRNAGAFVSAIVNGGDGGDAVPENLRPYLRKLAKHAYRITDDDIAALRSEGYSEDMIFELTASAALAVGLAQMDRGLAALAAAGPSQNPPRRAR